MNFMPARIMSAALPPNATLPVGDGNASNARIDRLTMDEPDRRTRLDVAMFSYRTFKNGTVRIAWHGRPATTLAGAAAARFLDQVDGLDDRAAQLVMAKVTGNFKRGNERLSQERSRT